VSPGARTRVFVAASILALTLLGFFRLPGRTYLQQDTQIYLPILERFWDSSVFGRELLARDPHVSFTIYDETALALRRLTGLDFQGVLVLQQFVFRALGLLGVYLLATSLGLRPASALLVTGIFSLGVKIWGPEVLSLEYEPVPRGYAIPLVLFALGLVAHGRDLAAGAAVALAFLYHPPSVLPFWAVYFALTLWPARPAIMSRRILGLIPMLAGVVVLFILSRLQAGVIEPQDFFSRLSPELERIQRLRAPYNWISTWPGSAFTHYVFLWLVSLAAFWRIRRWASQDVRFFTVGLPLFGMLTLPACSLALDWLKWSVIPQAQPARALLFVTVMALVVGAVAAVKAAERRAWWEALLWFALAFAIPAHQRVLEVLLPSNPLLLRTLAVVLGLALLATLALWALGRNRRGALALWAAALLLPAAVLPRWAGVHNYPRLETPELHELSQWARSQTPKPALFFFPDAGKGLAPGVFRARALRALYVDWKGGGQVNFLKEFAREWWARWQKTGAGTYPGADLALYRSLGIDYIVLEPRHRLGEGKPVFENAQFLAYATGPAPNTSE
jgi:hypothetical protein